MPGSYSQGEFCSVCLGYSLRAFQAMLVVKNLSVNAGDLRSLGQEDPLEEGRAIHSSILAWRILWTEEPGRLQSMGSQRVRHDCNDLAHMHSLDIYLISRGDSSLKPS